MAFRGWPVEALEFYEGLEADNSKAYWQDHKHVYEQAVVAPTQALLDEIAGEFGAGKIYRPYRDVRFSADKSPYKTAMGASLAGGGYVQLSAHGLGVGCGYYMMAPDQLKKFRDAIVDDASGRELESRIGQAGKAGLSIASHDSLKTAPRGYPKDHPRADLLRHKGLITWKDWPVAAWLGTAQAKRRVVETLRAARPLMGWLDDNVGPTTMEGNWG